MARKKARVVEIDDRLTNLFYARRNGEEPDEEVVEVSEQQSADNSWLLEFQSQTSTRPQEPAVPATEPVSTIVTVNLAEVRPFWALEDRKNMTSLWRRSKIWLAKDCQKQRKAALRKTSTK